MPTVSKQNRTRRNIGKYFSFLTANQWSFLAILLAVVSAYFIFNDIQIMIDINKYYTNNYIFVGIVVFVFAYVLSKKFNKEFEELLDLKNNLHVDQLYL